MKTFKRIIGISLLLILTPILGFVLYLENAIDSVMTEENQVALIQTINSSPVLNFPLNSTRPMKNMGFMWK